MKNLHAHTPIDRVDFIETWSNTLNGKRAVYLSHLMSTSIHRLATYFCWIKWNLMICDPSKALQAHLRIAFCMRRTALKLQVFSLFTSKSNWMHSTHIWRNLINTTHQIITTNEIQRMFWFHLHHLHTLVWLEHFSHVLKLRCLHSCCVEFVAVRGKSAIMFAYACVQYCGKKGNKKVQHINTRSMHMLYLLFYVVRMKSKAVKIFL